MGFRHGIVRGIAALLAVTTLAVPTFAVNTNRISVIPDSKIAAGADLSRE